MLTQRLTLQAYRALRRLGRVTGVDRWRMFNGRKVGGFVGSIVRRLVALSVGHRPVVVRGHRMLLPRRCDIAAWLLTNTFEQGTTEFFERFLDEGMVVVDGGAYVGYYTLLAARRVGRSGRVYAFEPQSDNFALLVKNVELNGYRNVIPVKQALGAASGEATLHLEGSALHSLYPPASSSGKSEPVEVVTLDEFLESEGWPAVDLVKLDLEGGEPAALEGMRRLLERSATIRLVLELNPVRQQRARADSLVFLQRLQSLGFDVAVIDDRTGLPLDARQVLTELKDEAVNLLCQRAVPVHETVGGAAVR